MFCIALSIKIVLKNLQIKKIYRIHDNLRVAVNDWYGVEVAALSRSPRRCGQTLQGPFKGLEPISLTIQLGSALALTGLFLCTAAHQPRKAVTPSSSHPISFSPFCLPSRQRSPFFFHASFHLPFSSLIFWKIPYSPHPSSNYSRIIKWYCKVAYSRPCQTSALKGRSYLC